jgi:hypothetical protein
MCEPRSNLDIDSLYSLTIPGKVFAYAIVIILGLCIKCRNAVSLGREAESKAAAAIEADGARSALAAVLEADPAWGEGWTTIYICAEDPQNYEKLREALEGARFFAAPGLSSGLETEGAVFLRLKLETVPSAGGKP